MLNIRKEEVLHTRNFGGTRTPETIDTVVIHHTGGGIGGLLPTLRERGLSYHYAIEANGNIIQFAEPSTIAFHARHLNATSIGVAFVGNFTNGEPTIEAYNTCVDLIKSLKLPNLKEIVGHGERMATACPANVNVRLISERVSPQQPPECLTPEPKQEVSDWAKTAWAWATENGITDGTRPQDNITRQEVITMLHRLYNFMQK